MRIVKKLERETISAIPAIIYFLIVLNLIYFLGALARQPGDIRYFSFLEVTIGALIIGKVIVIINCFSFINAYPNKPMIYNIIWKLFIYILSINILCFMHVLIHLSIKNKSLIYAMHKLTFDIELPIFWSTEISLVLVFLAYLMFSEFVRVLGKKKMMHLLFGTKE